MSDNRRDDLWDRLTDAALREALGGKRPKGHKAQLGGVTPASRAGKSRGAGAGKGKRPTSADRAGWMRAGEPRGSALKVLVVSTCVVVGLALVIAINHAAGDRPWLWPVAKHEVTVLDGDSSMMQSENDLRNRWLSGQLHADTNREELPASKSRVRPYLFSDELVDGGEQFGGSAKGGGYRASQSGGGWAASRREGFARNGQPPGRDSGVSKPYYEMSGERRHAQSAQKLIRDQQQIDDLILSGSGTPPGTPPRGVGHQPFILDPKPDRPVIMIGGRPGHPESGTPGTADGEAKPADNAPAGDTSNIVILSNEVDGKVLAELTKLKLEAVDGGTVALALRAVTGKEAEPEVIKGFLEKAKDGRGAGPGQGGDRYQPIYENRFLTVGNNPLSTFSIDVDTASYSKVRRILFQHGELPPPDAVRLEEFVNYHVYRYAGPEVVAKAAGAAKSHPFAVHGDVAACPWRPEHKLLRIAIKGREIKNEDRPPSNLVFLVDVSGSMDEPDRLPLVKKGLKTLVQRLRATDRVAIVVYAGAAGLVLPSTPGNEKAKILGVLDSLKPEGSTNGAQGIHLAYDIAAQNFLKEGTNRVILATDGDFNVGTTSDGELVRLVEERAMEKVFLTTLGFGIGNHNDSMLEQIADKGNGQCAYIDTELETYKVFVEQLSGTLVTIAKDVKIQVEFNPAKVVAYRLLGYENRMLRTEDFKDDTKDAGEIGAGHTVTALYEIVPVAIVRGPVEAPVGETETTELKYQKPAELTAAARSGELLTVHLRYKQPEADKSQPLDVPVKDAEVELGKAPDDFRFAAAVASFGMILRNSQYRGTATYDNVLELAKAGLADDEHGYRAEFIDLVKRAKEIAEGRKDGGEKKP